ncbi:MAG: YvcK family protein [Chloroflexi bacterium]|nr:YvcK family protein [Chloroflexota bacterium]
MNSQDRGLWTRDLLKWLHPGIHVKRWIAGLTLGVALLSTGIAYIFVRFWAPPGSPFYAHLPSTTPFLAFILGLIIAALSLVGLYMAVISPLKPHNGDTVVNHIYRYRRRQKGPRVVAIGGGTGLATLLRGLKEHTDHLSAIVTVADDGGSSGRLRKEMGVLPPGDFRNCIVALAETEPMMSRLFEYRFGAGSGLEGHSFGNLFIAAMSDVTGKFPEALKEASRVLAVRGQVLPSTLENVALKAILENGSTILGESVIPNGGGRISHIELEPANPLAYPEAVRAIQEAELIVIGPGSLYTSILPNLLVAGIAQALRESSAAKVYVCNVATQPGETDGYTVLNHVEVLHRHVGSGLFNYVLVNSNATPLPAEWPNRTVEMGGSLPPEVTLVTADLVREDYRLRHEPGKLAARLMSICANGGPERASRAWPSLAPSPNHLA